MILGGPKWKYATDEVKELWARFVDELKRESESDVHSDLRSLLPGAYQDLCTELHSDLECLPVLLQNCVNDMAKELSVNILLSHVSYSLFPIITHTLSFLFF